MSIAQRLKEIREELHLTQNKLADEIDIKLDRVVGLENGRIKKLTPEEVDALEAKFSINRSWLINGKGNMILNKNGSGSTVVGVINGNMTINTSTFDHPEHVKEIIELLKFAPPPLLDSFKEKLLKIKDITEDK